ncbi:MAG: hypothetical protein EOO18_07905 [Chryseobacterium sp.]|nr:MAG: hypothetical protein EOO18_07905 [Chryseobacterium sp.]
MENPFQTYFMGGFECADHINRHGNRVNLLTETQHHLKVEEDYLLLLNMGISTVREGICWSFVEQEKNNFDFSEVQNRIKIAEKFGIQIIWDLIHFGYPDDIFPTHPKFGERFENLCRAFVQFYKANCSQKLLIVPINEISFLSWFSGEARGTVPFAHQNGWDIKYHLCKAAIRGIKVLKQEDPTCVIVMVEPLVKVHSDGFTREEDLRRINEYQFEAVDMITGRLCPELGGQEDFLQILGLNYYWTCQWTGTDSTLCWPDTEGKRIPLHQMLQNAYVRYQKPIFLSETGHFGEGRVEWIEEVAQECFTATNNGVEFWGICIYPVTDRPDWDDLTVYYQSGIFDLDDDGNRIPIDEYINSVINLQIQAANYQPLSLEK